MAEAFNVAVLVFVEISSVSLIERSVNSSRRAALSIVEREIPPVATLAATRNSDIPGVINVKSSAVVPLVEFACLLSQLICIDSMGIIFKLETRIL